MYSITDIRHLFWNTGRLGVFEFHSRLCTHNYISFLTKPCYAAIADLIGMKNFKFQEAGRASRDGRGGCATMIVRSTPGPGHQQDSLKELVDKCIREGQCISRACLQELWLKEMGALRQAEEPYSQECDALYECQCRLCRCCTFCMNRCSCSINKINS